MRATAPAGRSGGRMVARLRLPSLFRLSLLGQFGVISAMCIVALGIMLGWSLNETIRQRALSNAEQDVALVSRLGIQPLLTSDEVDHGIDSVHLVVIDQALHTESLGPDAVRIIIWNRSYTVVYANDRNLVGRQLAGYPELKQPLAGRTISKLLISDPLLPGAPNTEQLLAVYVPLHFREDAAPVGVVQMDLPYGPIEAEARADTLKLFLILAGGLTVLYTLLFRLVAQASARLRRQAREKEHQAMHDALTGLPNRSLFLERLRQVMGEMPQAVIGVMIMDLDRFKEVNDTLGHHVGDLLLQEVGRRLQTVVFDRDVVARLGGDEFAILLPDVQDRSKSRVVAEKLLKTLEQPFDLEGLELNVTSSIGIALFPEHGNDVESLIRRADVAMYRAKEAHDRYEIYGTETDPYVSGQLELLGELHRAIVNGELAVFYQPKVEFGSGRPVGAEALVRWHHPRHGLLPPNRFIPLAEPTGIIKPLTLYVLETALGQCKLWHEQGFDLTVAVNLSARNLLDLQFPDDVGQLLEAKAVPAAWLVLEITESTLMADPLRAKEVLTRLSRMGIELAIDDFGTGYSSLASLQQLPVDEIKIDKSFVLNMASNGDNAMIVRSVIELARNLRLRTVAEGVENEEIYRRLEGLSCDVAQGFYLSRPIPADALRIWLSRKTAGSEAA